MKDYLLVTQGAFAACLFRKLLGADLGEEVEVRDGGLGGASAVSEAMSRLPQVKIVALVIDGGSCDPLKVRKLWSLSKQLLSMVAFSDRWKIFVIVPELEVLLFREEMLRQIVAHPPSPRQLERAHTKPRRVMQELLGERGYSYEVELAQRLESVDVSPRMSLPLRQEILSYFRSIPDYLRSPPGPLYG